MHIRLRRRDRDIVLLIVALIVVAMLWGPLYFLARILLFAVLVYFVYQLLRAYL